MSGSFASLARLPLGGVPFAAPSADADEEPLANVGRRAAPRLRLSIPARLVTVSETRRCVLLDVSRCGAQISLAKPLSEGEAGFLHFANTEVFVSVIRKATGLNGVEFDVPLSDEDVLAIRRYAEDYEADERRALRSEARAWVAGTSHR
ncbi:MAG: PilZ domain-containing protein [Pseudomonadota bacterium]